MNKIALIYHSADVDGLASGALLEYVFRNLSNFGNKLQYDLIGYNYGVNSNENQWLTNKDYTEYFFVDCTPPIGWVEKNIDNIKSGKIRLNIFDHHEPIKNIFRENGYDKNINYFFNKEMCGALIFFSTFQEFFLKIHDIDLSILNTELKEKQIYEKLTLISSYDTWQFDTWKDIKKILGCIGFTEYLYMQTNNLKDFFKVFFETSFNQIFSGGMLLAEYKLSIAENQISNGFYSEKEKLFIVEGNTSWFVTQKIIGEYPFCEKIVYFKTQLNREQIQVKLSCRACIQDTFDCVDYLNKLCDMNSGGHFNASGGVMSYSIFNRYLEQIKFGN